MKINKSCKMAEIPGVTLPILRPSKNGPVLSQNFSVDRAFAITAFQKFSRNLTTSCYGNGIDDDDRDGDGI